ncbi:MAG: hypothetical protein KJO32_08815, partial [Deltaproteobacteria bacterium]|nr:hypothetical protein [Deltaproteobacteria bacterium]
SLRYKAITNDQQPVCAYLQLAGDIRKTLFLLLQILALTAMVLPSWIQVIVCSTQLKRSSYTIFIFIFQLNQ